MPIRDQEGNTYATVDDFFAEVEARRARRAADPRTPEHLRRDPTLADTAPQPRHRDDGKVTLRVLEREVLGPLPPVVEQAIKEHVAGFVEQIEKRREARP
jgi:hypothetical protein